MRNKLGALTLLALLALPIRGARENNPVSAIRARGRISVSQLIYVVYRTMPSLSGHLMY